MLIIFGLLDNTHISVVIRHAEVEGNIDKQNRSILQGKVDKTMNMKRDLLLCVLGFVRGAHSDLSK